MYFLFDQLQLKAEILSKHTKRRLDLTGDPRIGKGIIDGESASWS